MDCICKVKEIIFSEAQRKAEEYKHERENKMKPEEKGRDLNPTSILSTTGDGTKVQIPKQMAKTNLHFVQEIAFCSGIYVRESTL